MTCIRKNLCMKESLAYVQRKKSPLEKCRPYTFSRPSCPQKQSLAIRQLPKDQRQEPAHETEAAHEDHRLLSLSYGRPRLPPPGPNLLWAFPAVDSGPRDFNAPQFPCSLLIPFSHEWETPLILNNSRLFCVTLNWCARTILYLKGGLALGY